MSQRCPNLICAPYRLRPIPNAKRDPAAPEFLVENGLASFTGACGTGGFCMYPLFTFTGEFFAACADDAEGVL